MMELFQFEFVQHAILAAILASIACGIIGTLVVVKRIVFISGGIAHSAFGGIGLGYFLGINPVVTIIPFSLASAVFLGVLSRKSRISEDSAIGLLWSVGMAIGILLIGITPGYAPDLFSYLFGNILTVPFSDLLLMAGLDLIIVAAVFLGYRFILYTCFDEEFSQTRGIPTFVVYLLLLSLVSLTIVILIRIVGVILVISLLTIPATVSKFFTYRLKTMMLLSIVWGLIFTLGGLALSYYFDLPSGATIILFSTVVYLVCWFVLKKKGNVVQ